MSVKKKPRIAALETSTRTPEIALCAGGELIDAQAIGRGRSTAAELVPALRDLLEKHDWRPQDVDVVGVSIGPGSFTGLRVGLTVAKTWAHVTQAALVGINTFEVLAHQVPDASRIAPVVPAQRGQVFATLLERQRGGGWETLIAPSWWEPGEWLAQATGATFVGEGVPLLEAATEGELQVSARDTWVPRAETVAHIAMARWSAGMTDDPLKLAPMYLRPSAAEEKRQGS